MPINFTGAFDLIDKIWLSIRKDRLVLFAFTLREINDVDLCICGTLCM